MPALTQNFETTTAALLPDLIWEEILEESGAADPILAALPPSYSDFDQVKYDQYEDPYGLLPLRGLDAEPEVLQMPGYRTYQFAPGYFGATTQLRETEITSERQAGTVSDPIDVGDRLGTMMLYFSTMVVSRFRKTAADLLLTGKISITGQLGQKFQFKMDNYNTLSPSVGWAANPTTATPINDMLGWKATLQKGSSSKFDQSAVQLMNSFSLNDLFATTQIQSVYKSEFGATPIGLDGVNKILIGYDLPPIQVYDKGYFPTLADAKNRTFANWQYVIPNKSIAWIGKRPKGQQIGQFQLTRHAGLVEAAGANRYPSLNVENESAAEIAKGLYVRAHYQNRMPHRYDIELGFNGCPVLWYGSATAGISYT
jgi:hypothetical protein